MPFTFTPELAKTLFSVSLTVLVAVLINLLLHYLIRVPHHFDTRRSRTFITLLRTICTVVVYIITFYIVLVELGINITPLLASAGIIGVILGLGAKTMIEDIIAGVFLLSQQSIAIGDVVKIDDAEGWIEKITVRTLTIRAEGGSLHIIPNGQIKKVINFSRHRYRVQVEIPVKADQNIDKVMKALEEALQLVEKDPEVKESLYPGSFIKGIDEFRAVGPMIIRVSLITYPDKYLFVGRKYRFFVKKVFEKHKIQFG
jgi:moderate conductance mechanosensitive channel